MDHQKSIFLTALAKVLVFLISRNIEETNTSTEFEGTTPRKSPNEPHKNQFLKGLIEDSSFF